jgi:hypothetical protein
MILRLRIPPRSCCRRLPRRNRKLGHRFSCKRSLALPGLCRPGLRDLRKTREQMPKQGGGLRLTSCSLNGIKLLFYGLCTINGL